MDDEDDRRLLDIIGDVQALNDYLHGSSNKSIDEDDVRNAAFGTDSFFSGTSVDPISALNDGPNHLGEMEGSVLQLSSSLQFIEEELGRPSPSAVELGEEQPFDILQKSLQEADITEQTLAQEALLESPSSSLAFPQQLMSDSVAEVGVSPLPVMQTQSCAQFPGVQPPQGFLQQLPPPTLPNGSAGHIQLLGSYNTSMMTISGAERPQVLPQPGIAGEVLVRRPSCTPAAVPGVTFSPSPVGEQLTIPFKGGGAPVPLQNIIIQRGGSSQILVKPIQPKPFQVGGQPVYSVSGVSMPPPGPTPTAGTYAAVSSTQTSQHMTVNIVSKPVTSPQLSNHCGSIVIHSALGQQQQQAALPLGQYRLPTSLTFTPSTTSPNIQTLNGQVQGTTEQAFVTHSGTSTYSGAFLTNQSAAVQLVAGQNFLTAGQLVVNQGVVSGQLGQSGPTVVQVSQATGATTKALSACASGAALVPTPVQAHYTLVNATDSAHVGYAAQAQKVQVGAASGLQDLQLGQHVLVQHSSQQGTAHLQSETQPSYQCQDSQLLSATTKIQDTPREAQLLSVHGSSALKATGALETVVLLPCHAGSTHAANRQVGALKRPAPQQLTKGDVVLQHLQRDQLRGLAPDRSSFSSLSDAMHRLLAYHVFQSALPSTDDLRRVDEEFEEVASQALKQTQAMMNKYHRLLLVDAERACPSSEIVMIARTFNQDERRCLTHDKRLAMVDPEGYMEDFCCPPKAMHTVQGVAGHSAHAQGTKPPNRTDPPGPLPRMARGEHHYGNDVHMTTGGQRGCGDPCARTEPQPGCKDPGGEVPVQQVSISAHLETAIKSILEPKRAQGCSLSMLISGGSSSASSGSGFATPPYSQSAARLLRPQHSEPDQEPLADTDSVLEAAVNSILEC